MLDTLLYAALIYVLWKPLAMNTIGPLIVWKTVKIPTEITFVPLDEEAFMAERNERFRAYDQDLGKLNFRTIGTSTLSDTQSSWTPPRASPCSKSTSTGNPTPCWSWAW